MRARFIAAGLTAVLAAALVAAVLTAMGGASPAAPRLAWLERSDPQRVAGLPDDRMVAGRIVNRGEATITFRAADGVAVTADGRLLETSVSFQNRYAKSLYLVDHPRQEKDVIEAVRVGRLLRLKPGANSPVRIGWRGGHAVELRLGGFRLALR